MSEQENDSDAVRTVDVRRTSHVIDGQVREGLLEASTVSYAPTDEGWTAFGKDLIWGDARKELLEAIDELEERARAVARKEGHESGHDRVRSADGGKVEDSTRVENTMKAGMWAKEGSPSRFALYLEFGVSGLRRTISEFEKAVDDLETRRRFYRAMERTIHTTRKLELISIAELERDALRGGEGHYNHHGERENEQRDAVRRIRELTVGDTPKERKKTRADAIRLVAAETGKSRQAVYGWIKRFSG